MKGGREGGSFYGVGKEKEQGREGGVIRRAFNSHQQQQQRWGGIEGKMATNYILGCKKRRAARRSRSRKELRRRRNRLFIKKNYICIHTMKKMNTTLYIYIFAYNYFAVTIFESKKKRK